MAIPLEELQAKQGFTTAHARARSRGCPSPSGAERRYTVISVDDHIVEPPDAFEGRLPGEVRRPRAARRRARRRQRGVGLRRAGAAERRLQRGRRSAGRGVQLRADPLRRDAPRRVGHPRPHRRHGPQRRVRVAVLPVVPPRVRRPAAPAAHRRPRARARRACGRGTTGCIEEWAGVRARAHDPAADPVPARPRGRGATRCARNAERGFKAMTFSEAPHMLGLPSLHTGHWDPLMAACEETGTVVCLHVGSSGTSPATSPDAPSDTIGVLFFGYAMFAAVDWLYSRIPVRFPDLEHLPVRGWHRLGRGPARPARARAQVRRDVRHVERHRPEPGRHVPPQLLGLRDRRPVGVPAARRHRRRATSSWSPTTRTPTRPGRTRRSASPRSSPGCPTPRSRASPGRTRRSCSATRCPTRCSVTRMPTDVGPSTRRSGRSSAVATARVAALRRRARTRGPTGGACPSRSRGPSRSTPPRPGAAPPQTVGGLDLVPGMIPARSPKTASPPRSARPSLDGRVPVLVWVPGGSYRIGGASLPDLRRRAGSPPTTWSSSASTTASARSAGSRPTACRRTSALRDLRGRGRVVARQRRRVRR